MHSNSPEPVNFFGEQSSLGGAQLSFGGAQAVIWGTRPQNAPRGARPDSAWMDFLMLQLFCPFFFNLLARIQGCPTFLLIRATFTGEKLLQATCIFTKIKLRIIASLLYKIGAHFGQYFGYLSPKVNEDQKKRSSPQIGADFRQCYGNLSQKVGEDQKKKKKKEKKDLRRKSDLIAGRPNQNRFCFRPFYLPENAK